MIEIISAPHAFAFLRRRMAKDVEEFWALALGPKKELIGSRMLFRGTADACMVHPRDVFRFACIANASSLLVAHNHPSDDPLPSTHDLRITEQLIKASRLIEIPIVDHLIITRSGYSSFAQKGWCRFESPGPD